MSATLGLVREVPLFIATLVAAGGLTDSMLDAAEAALAAAGCAPAGRAWLDEGDAADLRFAADPAAARAALERDDAAHDVIVQAEAGRAKRLMVADMDSTMIEIECIDELADYAGLKPQIAEVTERAMRGELDFAAALDARVALLAGLGEEAIERCHAERVRLMPGARTLVRTMRAHGATCVLVTGGFTVFADRVGASIGFDRVIANRLDLADGRLAGTVARPIVDAETKRATLSAERARLGLAPAQTLAVGDGANDIPMIREAGLGVAYHAKPKTAAAAHARVDRSDLHALLWAQGHARRDWTTA